VRYPVVTSGIAASIDDGEELSATYVDRLFGLLPAGTVLQPATFEPIGLSCKQTPQQHSRPDISNNAD